MMHMARSMTLEYGRGIDIDGIPFPFAVDIDVDVQPNDGVTVVTLPVYVNGVVTIVRQDGQPHHIDPVEGDVGEWARRIVREGLVESLPWLRLDDEADQ